MGHKLQKSLIPAIKSIQEHVLVPGTSHQDLWLGPSLVFKPGTPVEDLHLFFTVSDRTGGDSIQRNLHFTASRAPENADDFSEWHTTWERLDYPETLRERTDARGYRFVPTFNWKYHPASGKIIGFGHVLRHQGEQLSAHVEHCQISCAVYDPDAGTFSPWDAFRIDVEGEARPCVGYGQRVDLVHGDILLPFSTVKELNGRHSIRWCGSARCHFDGQRMHVVDIGNLQTIDAPRGLVEPSLACYGDTYYMTLRAQDGHAHVTTSTDGLTWAPPIPWRWTQGGAIAMDQTMTKFVNGPRGLFLVYTRITEDNTRVFRHRAPVYIAQVNPETCTLCRETESVLLGNRGFPLGNFNVASISPHEVWVTAPEWDRSGRNVPCDNRLARIIWNLNA